MASKYAADGKDLSSKCVVCRDDLEEPKSLPCEHKLCAQCLTQHVSASASANQTFPCPTCGMKCKSTDKGVIKAPPSKPSDYQAPLCVKKEHGPATVFCCDCDKFFCEICVNNHQLCDWMSDHKQSSVDEMSFYDIKYAQCSRKTCSEELLQSATEAKKGMNSMTDEAKKVINKQNEGLKDTLKTKETIRKDVKDAKESLEKAARKICETVKEYKKNLFDDLDGYEKEAIENLERIEDGIKVRKADAISLQDEIHSLQKFGKPTEQVECTSVLQEKFDAQQKVEAGSMTWKYVCERKELSEESVKSMLGDVKLVTPKITLGQPLQQVPLEYTGNRGVTGMVVVGDCLCVVHALDPHIWLYNITDTQTKAHVIPHLESPQGMALVNPTGNTVVIVDENKKGGQLHYVKISADLGVIHLSSKTIPLEEPLHISMSLDNSELLIGQWGNPQFLVCDLQGNTKRQVTVTSPDGTERFPWCVQQTASGYAALMDDGYGNSIIQWLREDGSCRRSYGLKDGELIKRGLHMIRDNAGQLVVVEHGNNRLHLVGSRVQRTQFLLTKDDGIVGPSCLILDESAGRLYVSHGDVGSQEVCVYEWLPKSGEFQLLLNTLKL